MLADGVPVAFAIAGWTLAGLGIGIGYPSVAALVLTAAPSGEEGDVSSALQLAETIGIALFTGIGGALIALGLQRDWDAVTALLLVFAAAARAAAGVAAGRVAGPASVVPSGLSRARGNVAPVGRCGCRRPAMSRRVRRAERSTACLRPNVTRR